jgi:FlaG/FlaF family flagellin (archaellin)
MTTLTIIKDDKFVAVDGEGLFLDAVVLAANVHAIQFDGTNGHIEYNDGTPNKAITSISDYSTITDDHASKKAANATAASDAATAQATLEATYGWKRANEYPSIADQLDDIYHNGIDAWKATIKTTKDKYPKE